MKSKIILNAVPVSQNTVKFSAGEIQLVLPEGLIKEQNFVEADIRCSEGVMLLLQLSSVIAGKDNNLHLGYLPYSRYDRVEDEEDCLSLKVFCNLVNSMGFSRVVVEDCHSDVGVALLDNCNNIPQHDLVTALVPDLGTYDAVVAPDGGSLKKAHKLAEILGVPVVKCDKVRDFKTGRITSFTVPEEELMPLTKILIVDDICDGGGTFVGLTGELHKYVPQIDLYVTHGIFSKGVEGLFDAGITNIFAFHDWIEDERVTSFFQ